MNTWWGRGRAWVRTSRGRRLVLWVSVAMLASVLLWLGWPFSLTYLREHNPKQTYMMKYREAQARHKHRRYRVHQRWVPLTRISVYLQKAVLIAEDDTFYQHHGVDFTEMWSSVKSNWKRKRYARGGSTLTQQVVKNLFLSPRKYMLRKVKELVLAFRLDRALSKKRILEIYLNIVEWGPGVFGAEAAAREYFGKSAADLSLDEAVRLAAVLPSPLRHSPVQEGRYLQWRTGMIRSRLERWGDVAVEAPLSPETPEWIAAEEADSAETIGEKTAEAATITSEDGLASGGATPVTVTGDVAAPLTTTTQTEKE